MAETTGINWCDSTFNPWIGCTRVSPACDDCYAARSTPARTRGIAWGAGEPRQRTGADNWAKPLKWDREPFYQCQNCGHRGDFKSAHKENEKGYPVCRSCSGKFQLLERRRVFCASLADWLDNEVPIEWLVDLLDLIRRTPNLDWLLLTKRIGNWRGRLNEAWTHLERCRQNYSLEELRPEQAWISEWLNGQPPANVWLGATAINQAEADRDVPKLLQVPARVRFLSVEPMLGPIDLTAIKQTVSPGYFGDCLHWYHQPHCDRHVPYPTINWIICGGESGPKARPMHPDWVRSLRDQCAAAGVPFLFKQWGEHLPATQIPGYVGWENKSKFGRSGMIAGKCLGIFRAPNGALLFDGKPTPTKFYGETMEIAATVGKDKAGNLLDNHHHLEWPA